ncbi:CHAD domain protein [Streptomyces sp. YIM 130001]|uniref:CHAD domain-containing protein n=1 Tax=Streptomyces sp. YIM 130001 TaxID=2259644 RepID=UPI000E651A87|nr:CHAD domain-containing protein [Streptomyces sp. YIM 130001]RII13507.1 CHAD domain protein [Streptomyces sp. YIM 130001]
MAQRHPDRTDPTADDVLARYLREQATEFLRALRQHRERGAEDTAAPALALRRAARRISGTLHTFRPLLDAGWSDGLRTELAWLSGTLAREHGYAARQERLLTALHRLSGASAFPDGPRVHGGSTANGATANGSTGSGSTGSGGTEAGTTDGALAGSTGTDSAGAPAKPAGRAPAQTRSTLTVGAAKAGALLERQLTLSRTRAHSTALSALGSSRFHGVADSVAVLASEVPLRKEAAAHRLEPFAADLAARLDEAVAALPLVRAGHPYNAEALMHGLAADTAPDSQDAPWHQVRLLLRLHRYAAEVTAGNPAHLLDAAEALDRHRDAAQAAGAAAAAARTPRISPATAYALGVLHADQRHEVEASRFTFHRTWHPALPLPHEVPSP